MIEKGKKVIENIESKYKNALEKWDGDLGFFEGTEEILESLLPLEKISDEKLIKIKERRGKVKILEEWTLRHTKMIQSKLSNSEDSQLEDGEMKELIDQNYFIHGIWKTCRKV